MRFTSEQVEQWHEDGFVVIENFFDAQEIAPVLLDFEHLYQHAGQGAAVGSAKILRPGDDAESNRALQFKNIHSLPYPGSSAINMISLHPQLIAFAKALLGSDAVHLYQSHTWAKYTGEADYDQDFHCDFGNHTLTVPADDAAARTVNFVFYLTDVESEHGALRYVTKPDVLQLFGRQRMSAPDPVHQAALRGKEKAVVVAAGGLVAHSIDTMHRGSNLTSPNGRRFSMTVGFKAAGNEQISFHVWQSAQNRPWEIIFQHANPEQLACLGIPKPGDVFWSERTLKLTQARWPQWDMADYWRAYEAAQHPT